MQEIVAATTSETGSAQNMAAAPKVTERNTTSPMYKPLRTKESGHENATRLIPVRPSTSAYWRASGMTPSV